MSLYVTPTRLDLLIAVSEQRVVEGITEDSNGHTWLVEEGYPNRKVCFRIREAQRASWVTLPRGVGPFWELTDAGHTAMTEALRGRRNRASG